LTGTSGASDTVTLAGLEKRYGSTRALDGVSLAVAPGEFFTLLGPSGCGKTTTLRSVAGFVTPDAGEVAIDGRIVTRVPPHLRRVGMVFQHYALFPHRTVAQNVGFGLRIQGLDRARRAPVVERFLKLVGLWDDRQKFPRQLSGGMKQRIQIARALAIDPAILLMDEPFAALDAITRRLMHTELLRIWAATGKTVVFVTHDVSEALVLADRVGVMTRGPNAGLKAVLPIPLPRPRDPGNPRFGETFARVEALLLPEAQSG